jgi:hypothetical protein
VEIYKKKTKNLYKRTTFGFPIFMKSEMATQIYLKHITTTLRNENAVSGSRDCYLLTDGQ